MKAYQPEPTDGEITHQSGYHQPPRTQDRRLPPGNQPCGCDLETTKGAYRDTVIQWSDGTTTHYYHQTPIVEYSPDGETIRYNGHGYLTGPNGGIGTTSGRISTALPTGYRLRREDWQWYLETPNGRREITDNRTHKIEL